MKKVTLTILVSLLAFTFSFSQKATTNESIRRIESLLTEYESAGFSGTVLVELEGKKVISRGYGFRNNELREKNSPNTIFDIGSLTKQFTASAILKLEMQGKLSTSDKITKYFNNVPLDKASITIHDLLRHQSGLQSNVGGDYEPITESAFIDSVMKSNLLFEVGSDFSYANIGYSLLALIIEKVSGQAYEQYLYSDLWKPSGMEETGYSRPDFNKNLIAVGYNRSSEPWGKPTEKEWNGKTPFLHLLGNGGILSTTEDLYKWHQILMTDKVLSKSAKDKLYHPLIRSNENADAIYGYGWDVYKTKRGTYRVWHNGTNNIFYADFMRFIDEGVTLILMSNKAVRGTDQINFEIAKIIFNESYRPVVPKPDNQVNQKFSREIIDVILQKGLAEAKLKYNRRPSDFDILEYILNTEGYEMLSQQKYEEAIAIFQMNCDAYPNSFNAFDSLGEAYMRMGDKQSAIINYRKSLALDPENANAEDMIKQLMK